MRVRKQDADGDMMFGHGSRDFHHDTPEGVGQLIKTRLLLWRGEWFLNLSEGTPWGGLGSPDVVARGQVLGSGTQAVRDTAVKTRVSGTQGVATVVAYTSQTDPNTRAFRVQMAVNTIYGPLLFPATARQGDMFTIGMTPLGGGAGLG